MYQQKIEIKNRIQAINERMKEERVTATAGISDGHSSRGIYRAWQEAGEALEESFYIGRGAVIFWEGLREDSIWTEEKTEVLCKAVLQAGERADKEALGQAVTKLKRYAADARPGKGQLKEFLMRIVHELTKNMEGLPVPGRDEDSLGTGGISGRVYSGFWRISFGGGGSKGAKNSG